MSNKQFLELINEVHMMENARHQNIDTFTELLVAVIKAFIDQARSGRSYMPTHAEFQGIYDSAGWLIFVVVYMRIPSNIKDIGFRIDKTMTPECVYDGISSIIERYEQPKKDVNQYDNRTDKTSNQGTFLQLPS
jgi:hypothetical protein